ncbi:MAG: hypothetical protein M1825_002847 [Sarcosagium campestre]|nr:MAG: hypothetical protein M1825_002847 [Sarcosagium campestre]
MAERERKAAKLPIQQLTILCICRFSEPLILTSVFPYLPEMMEFLGVRRAEIGFYAGLTGAVFSLCQSITGVPWGWASDRWGRKTAILTGTTCTMLTSMLFGFSRSLTWAIVSRGLAGAGNGNIGIIRTMVAELVPEKSLQPRAFSIVPFVWTMGSILGPAYGGFLADPARKHPEIFGRSRFFLEYPYALPNLLSSALFVIGLILGVLFLHETLEHRKHERDYGIVLGQKLTRPCRKCWAARKVKSKAVHEETDPLLGPSVASPPSSSKLGPEAGLAQADDPNATTPQKAVSYKEVFTRQASLNLAAYGLLSLHSIGFDQLLPVYMHHARQSTREKLQERLPFRFVGGFGIGSQRIGLLFALYGVCGVIVQFIVYPPIARRFGILNCLKVCCLVFPIIAFVTPFTALIENHTRQQAVMFVLMAIKSIAVVFAFPSSTILLTNSASSVRVLATLNGVATSIAALGRAAGPAIGGATFTWGVRMGYLILPWWVIAALSTLGAIPIFSMVESDDSDDPEGNEDEARGLAPQKSAESGDHVAGGKNVEPEMAETDERNVKGPRRQRASGQSA